MVIGVIDSHYTPSTKCLFNGTMMQFQPAGSVEDYKQTEIAIKLLRSEVARALKVGEEVPGARVEQTTRLVIQARTALKPQR